MVRVVRRGTVSSRVVVYMVRRAVKASGWDNGAVFNRTWQCGSVRMSADNRVTTEPAPHTHSCCDSTSTAGVLSCQLRVAQSVRT